MSVFIEFSNQRDIPLIKGGHNVVFTYWYSRFGRYSHSKCSW